FFVLSLLCRLLYVHHFVTIYIHLCFFLYCSGHHRDLHSFPTRRSSDLPPGTVFGSASVSPPASRLWPTESSLSIHCIRRVRSSRDRKSTRLNSSHGSISYAVFCLKKKKKN